MKILMSASVYTPNVSGLTIAIQNLAKLLEDDGYEITILTTQHKKGLPLREKIDGVSVVRIPYLFQLKKGYIMPTFLLEAFAVAKKNDMVFINLPQFEGLLIALAAKMQGKKVHCFYHCNVTLDDGFFAKIIERVLRLSNRLCLSLADTISATSEDFARHDPLLKSKKVASIYPVIKDPEMSLSAKKNISKLLPKRKYVIGYVGRIATEKGIEYLLESIPQLQKNLGKDFVIVLAGPTTAIGEEAYTSKINSALIIYQDHVQLLGEVSLQDLGSLYAAFDVLVLPSINSTEAFGMVQVEAMLCGTPVVASDLPGVREPVRVTGMGEIAKVKNTNDVTNKIVKILKNKEQYVKDKKVIQEIFSSEKILTAYKEILQ